MRKDAKATETSNKPKQQVSFVTTRNAWTKQVEEMRKEAEEQKKRQAEEVQKSREQANVERSGQRGEEENF